MKYWYSYIKGTHLILLLSRYYGLQNFLPSDKKTSKIIFISYTMLVVPMGGIYYLYEADCSQKIYFTKEHKMDHEL